MKNSRVCLPFRQKSFSGFVSDFSKRRSVLMKRRFVGIKRRFILAKRRFISALSIDWFSDC